MDNFYAALLLPESAFGAGLVEPEPESADLGAGELESEELELELLSDFAATGVGLSVEFLLATAGSEEVAPALLSVR